MYQRIHHSVGQVFLSLLKAGCYLLLFLGCQMLVTMVITIAVMVFSMVNSGMDDALLATDAMLEQVMAYTSHIALFSAILTLVILLVVFLIRRKKVLAEVGLVKTAPRMVAAGVALAPGLYAVIITVLNFLPTEWLAAYNEASSHLDSTGPLAFLSTVIAAPIVEEVIFRGLIQSRLNRAMPGWLAVVISALVFGLCHGQAIWVAYASVIGLLFGWITLRAKSILPSMAVHVVFNAIGHFSVYFDEGSPDWAFIVFLAALLLISVVGCLLARKGLVDLFRRPAPVIQEVWDNE